MKRSWLEISAAWLGAFVILAGVVRAANSEGDAGKALSEQLHALKDTQTLQARFVCEKKLSLLETPLLSRGQLWIRKGDPREGDGAVRFSTEKPYVSELILAKGKVLARSQHESEWTKSNQSGRPGLTAVMGELGGWSTGEADKLTEQYSTTASSQSVPAMPSADATATAPAKQAADVFVLTPTNKDLLKAVKRITVAIDPHSHHLLFIEILTQQDDATRYWFYDVKTNPVLPADTFAPGEKSSAGEKP